MNVQATRRYIGDHFGAATVVAGVLMLALAVAVAILATGSGSSSGSGAQQAVVDISAGALPAGLLEASPQNVLDAQYAEQNWDVGTRAAAAPIPLVRLSPEKLAYQQHNWDLRSGSPMIENSVLGMTADQIAYLEQNPDVFARAGTGSVSIQDALLFGGGVSEEGF